MGAVQPVLSARRHSGALTPGAAAASVEGIWQALKVLEQADVDESTMAVTMMTGRERTMGSGSQMAHRC
jgi:hypothetical protein